MMNRADGAGSRSPKRDRRPAIAVWTFAVLEAIGIAYLLWSR
jgi:hypothetical protein